MSFAADVDLIVANAKLYNAPESVYYVAAERFEESAKLIIAAIRSPEVASPLPFLFWKTECVKAVSLCFVPALSSRTMCMPCHRASAPPPSHQQKIGPQPTVTVFLAGVVRWDLGRGGV